MDGKRQIIGNALHRELIFATFSDCHSAEIKKHIKIRITVILLSVGLGDKMGYVVTEVGFFSGFAAVATIMVYVSLDQLLPTADEYGEHHWAIGGLIFGMLVMAINLLLSA